MTDKKIKIGVFPCDLETVMADKKNSQYDFFYLTAIDTAEQKWLTQFVKKEKIIYYHLAKNKHRLEENDFTDIFSFSDVTKAIKAKKLNYLWLTVNNHDRAFLKKWSEINKVKIIGPDFNLQANFESKIWFDQFLEKNNLPKPKSQIIHPTEKNIKISGKMVLQSIDSAGGEGTFFLDNKKQINDLLKAKKLNSQNKYLLRQFVTGDSFGITLFTTPKIIALSAIRLQCYQPGANKNEKIFIGVQWQKNQIANSLKNKIDKTFIELGQLLQKNNFFGFANVDFILNKKGKIFILECNPRFSSATVQLLGLPKLIHGLKAGNLMVKSYLKNEKPSGKAKIYHFVKTNYEGAVLNIDIYPKKTLEIKKDFTPGVYTINKNQINFISPDIKKIGLAKNNFIYMSMAQKHEKYSSHTNIGTLFANYPLFTKNGSINPAGKKLLAKFKNYE
ncbi:MAG: ATP-grasp domain-containing protein [Candidatus Buchananbacteria bacterium]